MNESAVSLINVCKEFALSGENIPVLRDINWQIPSQRAIALVGASGTGKTTLLNLLAHFETPSSGKIVWPELGDLAQLSRDQSLRFYQSHVGFVFQRFNLLSDLSVAENVCLPLMAGGWSTASAVRKATEILTRLSMSSLAQRRPRELSIGQQQRVAIARAVAKAPRVLLADEPTGSVDTDNKNVILQLLLNYQRENRCVLIIATHDKSVADACDQIVSIEGNVLKV